METAAQKLETYIKDELASAQLYTQLIDIAPSQPVRDLLNGFVKDEQRHAAELHRVYKIMTGREFQPDTPLQEVQGHFYDILKNRVISESEDYRTYAREYWNASSNSMLKSIYFRSMTDETVHALQLLRMLSKN